MRLYAVFSFGAMPSKILKVKKVKNIPWQSPINCLHAHISAFVLTGRHHTYLDFRNIACTTPCVNPMGVAARAKKLSTKKAEVPWPQWAPHAPVTWYRYLLRPVLYGPWVPPEPQTKTSSPAVTGRDFWRVMDGQSDDWSHVRQTRVIEQRVQQ